MTTPGRDWLVLCGLHGVVSMLGWWGPELVQPLVWRVDDWGHRWWTIWSTAWVHVNTPHLIANQMALGLLTAFSWVVRPDRACALAWFLAWPITYLAVAAWPQVGHVTGLAGLIHAALAVVAVHLFLQRLAVPQARRWGLLLGALLLGKLLLEQAWSQPVVWDGANDMSVVRGAWFSGTLAGGLLGALTAGGAVLLTRLRTRT